LRASEGRIGLLLFEAGIVNTHRERKSRDGYSSLESSKEVWPGGVHAEEEAEGQVRHRLGGAVGAAMGRRAASSVCLGLFASSLTVSAHLAVFWRTEVLFRGLADLGLGTSMPVPLRLQHGLECACGFYDSSRVNSSTARFKRRMRCARLGPRPTHFADPGGPDSRAFSACQPGPLQRAVGRRRT
jgi:hypothetical protein